MKIALLGTVVASVFNFRTAMIKELVARDHTVYVFCVDYDNESRKRVIDLGGIPLDYSLNRAGLNPFRDIFDTLRLAKKLKEIAPDVVLSYFVKPVIFGSIAARMAAVPKNIGMLEGLGYVFTDLPTGLMPKQRILRWVQVFLYRLALPGLDHLIFLNPDDAIDLLECNKLNVRNVSILGGIGVDLARYVYTPLDIRLTLSFIFVGRLLAEKGINEYVAAAKKIKSLYPEIRFVVLGGLDEENPGGLSRLELEDLIATGVIEYPGHVSCVKNWLANASVFVLPSYREGVPCSTQEAMAIGRAVITTDVPGCRETVLDGINGYLIPRWNSEALAEKMFCFINEPELAKKMGVESRHIAEERFDVNKVNERLIRILID